MSVFFLAAFLPVAVIVPGQQAPAPPLPSKEGAHTERNYIPLRKFYKFLLGFIMTTTEIDNILGSVNPTTTKDLAQANIHGAHNATGYGVVLPETTYSAGGYADMMPDYARLLENAIVGGSNNPRFGQEQLNNSMSGTDANAIYQANQMPVDYQNTVNSLYSLIENAKNAQRKANLDEFVKNYTQEQMYGEVLQQMIDNAQTQPRPLYGQRMNRPQGRERNITGRPSFEEGGAWIPADGELW